MAMMSTVDDILNGRIKILQSFEAWWLEMS
jgi:hypothetical protein